MYILYTFWGEKGVIETFAQKGQKGSAVRAGIRFGWGNSNDTWHCFTYHLFQLPSLCYSFLAFSFLFNIFVNEWYVWHESIHRYKTRPFTIQRINRWIHTCWMLDRLWFFSFSLWPFDWFLRSTVNQSFFFAQNLALFFTITFAEMKLSSPGTKVSKRKFWLCLGHKVLQWIVTLLTSTDVVKTLFGYI